jgi:hypothetical protein
LSQNVFAELPLLDIQGDFDYKKCSGGSPSTRCQLTLSNLIITGGNYLDGSHFGESDDAITDAYFKFTWDSNENIFFNSASDNLTFTPPSTVTFTITDGSTTYLSATLDNFLVYDYMFAGNDITKLNRYLTDDNITNVVFDTGTGADYSDYIAELQTTQQPYNLSWTFDFLTNGPYGDGSAFTQNDDGNFSGKLFAGPAIPEPVSSILFVAGGATLAFRRYWKRKKK